MENLYVIILIFLAVLIIDVTVNDIVLFKSLHATKKMMKNNEENLELLKTINTTDDIENCHKIHVCDAKILQHQLHQLNNVTSVYTNNSFKKGEFIRYYVYMDKTNTIAEEHVGIVIEDRGDGCYILTMKDYKPFVFHKSVIARMTEKQKEEIPNLSNFLEYFNEKYNVEKTNTSDMKMKDNSSDIEK